MKYLLIAAILGIQTMAFGADQCNATFDQFKASLRPVFGAPNVMSASYHGVAVQIHKSPNKPVSEEELQKAYEQYKVLCRKLQKDN